MTTREVLAIAIKLFALWALVQVFLGSPLLVVMLGTISPGPIAGTPPWVYPALVLTFSAIGIIIAIGLFKISNSVLQSVPDSGELNLDDQSQKFLLQLGGLFFLIPALTYFPSAVSVLFTPPGIVLPTGVLFRNLLVPAATLLEILIGIWLLLHPSWWSRLFNKLRARV